MDKKLGFFGVFIGAFLLLLGGVVFADTDGIWHYAKDIRGGVFGSDESDIYWEYTFPRNLTVTNVLDSERIGISTPIPRTELEIDGRWFVTSHGSSPSSGVGMIGSFNPDIGSFGAGLIQVYDYDSSNPRLLLFQGSGGNVQIGTNSYSSNLRVYGDFRINGSMLEGDVPWLRLSDHPSIITGSGLEGGGDLSETRTISLSSSLSNFNNLDGTGVVVKTGDDTYTTRSILGSSGRVIVNNNDGSSGNPTIDLVSTGVSSGNYGSNIQVPVITVDSFGRITSASNTNIRSSSTSQNGVVQLRDSVVSTSVTHAATANSVKVAYDNAQLRILRTGDIMTGFLTLHANPTNSMHAATKDYVDSVAAGVGGSVDDKVSKSGDTMSGILNMGGNRITNVGSPSGSSDVATKGYVDSGVNSAISTANNRVLRTGDTMTGTLSMNGNRITNVGAPTQNHHVATKGYVDTAVSGVGGGFTTCTTKSAELSSTRADGNAFYTTVYCDPGWTMTGGGIQASWWDTWRESYSRPSGNGFYCVQKLDTNRGNCYVRCCQ